MKIAIFTDTFIPEVNGVAKTLKRFTDYLNENQIEYRVFAPQSSNKNIFTTHVYSITSFPFFLYPECRVALPNFLHIRDEIQQFNPDIIHIATPFNIGLCGLHWAKKLDIPVVGSYHTDFDKYLTYYDLHFLTNALWKYMRWFHQPLRKIFVPSSDTMVRLQSKGFTNLSIWPRGVDSSVFHTNYNEQTVRKLYNIREEYILSYVGRIATEKDSTEFVLAITSLLAQEQTRKVMGENGKRYAKAQSWDSIFINLLLEYGEVLEAGTYRELA